MIGQEAPERRAANDADFGAGLAQPTAPNGLATLRTAHTNRLSAGEIQSLNERYAPLDCEERIRQLYRDFPPEKVLVTSSFAATSAFFLHVVSRVRPEQEIAFIDTGFHFPQTLRYKAYLTDLFRLKVFDVAAPPAAHERTAHARLWEADPDRCCAVNKIAPLEAIEPDYQVWISSLMRWQSEHRAGMRIFERRRGILKFHPMIDVTREERDDYIRAHHLPFHPLVLQGYASIGCKHCTVAGEGRSGRWAGKPKTECGLHL